jgi:hypothetical protein
MAHLASPLYGHPVWVSEAENVSQLSYRADLDPRVTITIVLSEEQTYHRRLREVPSWPDVGLPKALNTRIGLGYGDTIDFHFDLASCREDIHTMVWILGMIEDGRELLKPLV